MFGEAALRWFLTRSAPRRMRSALRPSSRRGCLPLLLAKAVLSTAAAVEVRRDRVDLLELSRKGEDFYQVQDSGWFCRMCPAGTYVAEHCKEQNGSSTCLPCEADGYVEYPSHFSRCLRCWTCREDQVELSPCSATRNTQCICKNGTFCSPDHPCEMCQKCQSRCPSGQVKIAPCTPHSDLLCGPPTGSFSGSYMIIIVIIVAVAVVLLLVLLWKCCCRHPAAGDSRDLGRKSGNVVVSRDGGSAPSLLCLQPPPGRLGERAGGCGQAERGSPAPPPGAGITAPVGSRGLQLGSFVFLSPQHYLVLQLTRRWRGGLGTRDNIRNEHLSRDQEQGLLPAVGAPSAPGLEEVVAMTSDPSVKTQKILVPVPGEDPVILLRRSFHVFARDVPFKDWKRYGRALDLLENDLALAEMNDKYSQEPFFQMLNMWQNKQGMSASVNTLLEALHRIDLGGIAEDISSKLVQQGSFQYQVS
ncbi:tumor necrosis factor receptor superfamily member 10B-like isoform X2 [Cygnus olor]|uniref:tumor necrosis factor receptor superfamily member 10B-like isoform X2 n=1 Tax=Cygnus olor TaxID=8869 RepID=UPI001ADE932B|nr:tumor necrosis factor receptor superfamily member 10B-like isoform X2 [Cygnus olor]